MAVCIALEQVELGGRGGASPTGKTVLPWVAGDAAYANGTYTCPSGTHLLLTVQEANQQISLPPLQITTAEGAQISGAILLIWGIGWGFRVLVQTLRNTDGNSTSETE